MTTAIILIIILAVIGVLVFCQDAPHLVDDD